MLIVGPYELADPASIFPKNNKIFFEAFSGINCALLPRKVPVLPCHITAACGS